MHAGEIEVARVGAGLVAGDFAEAGQAQAARPAGEVFQADAPAQDRALGVRRGLHGRAHVVKRVGDDEPIEADLFDPVFAGAARGLVADRPRRLALFAQIEEMPARLQRIERTAGEVDGEAAALVGHDVGRAAPVAHEIEADGAVVEGEAVRRSFKRRRSAGEGAGAAAPGFSRARAAMNERRQRHRGAGDAIGDREQP